MNSKTSRSKTFNSRLAAYSATAGAALIAAPMAADATIHNITAFWYGSGSATPTNTVPPSLSITPGIDGSTEKLQFGTWQWALTMKFGFRHGTQLGRHYSFDALWFVNRGPASSIATLGSHEHYMKNFHAGESIANRNYFPYSANGRPGWLSLSDFVASRINWPTSTRLNGSFVPAAGPNKVFTGYVGFRLIDDYYGWLRIQVSDDSHGLPDAVRLVDKDGDGIYGATGRASDNLKAGETAAPVPEPSSAAIGGLALLALGAMGVRELRRRKKLDSIQK